MDQVILTQRWLRSKLFLGRCLTKIDGFGKPDTKFSRSKFCVALVLSLRLSRLCAWPGLLASSAGTWLYRRHRPAAAPHVPHASPHRVPAVCGGGVQLPLQIHTCSCLVGIWGRLVRMLDLNARSRILVSPSGPLVLFPHLNT